MKKFLFLVMAVVATHASAQVDLIADLPPGPLNTRLIYIDHGLPKILVQNPTGFELYNLDNTLYTNVEYPGGGADYLTYITRSLVDCDTTQIEYILYGDSHVRILREDGTSLLDLENYWFLSNGIIDAVKAEPIVSDQDGSYVIFNEMGTDNQKLYHLCGQVPQALARTSDGSIISGMAPSDVAGKMHLFPNPGSDRIQIDYDLKGHSTGRVFLYDTSGKVVYEQRLGHAFEHIFIDISALTSGTYIAKITTDGGLVLTEKFVKLGN